MGLYKIIGHLSFFFLTTCTLACSFSPRYECPLHHPMRFVSEIPRYGPNISCCQSQSDTICDQISQLALSVLSLNSIESGSMGTVSTAKHPFTDELFAIKTFRPAQWESTTHFAAAIQREFSVGAAMAHHPAFARSYALLTDSASLQIHLVMEHVPWSLSNLLENADWTQDDIHCMFTMVLRAVLEFHDSGFAHRDLKPGNILLSAGGHVKMIDFGEATPLNTKATHFTGTPPYIAPELYQNEIDAYDAAAADMWSLGMLLLRLHLEEDPWDHSSISDEYFSDFLDEPSAFLKDLNMSADVQQAIRILLHMEPSRRYQIRQFWAKSSNESFCAIDETGSLHLPLDFA